MTDSRSTFPLRLRDPRLRDLVREVADREHISQNELIEQAISNEVVARGAMLAEDLAAASTRLAQLTAEQREQVITASIERFARGEADGEPLAVQALHTTSPKRRPASSRADPLGVIAAFDAGRR